MNTHLQNLLLSDQKGPCRPSGWKEDGLFSLCYSLLFRYHMGSEPQPDTRNQMMSVFILAGVIDRNIYNCIALFRAGYLTLFERQDDAAAVYKEFRKFDSLLTKLARCTLKRGKLYRSKLI